MDDDRFVAARLGRREESVHVLRAAARCCDACSGVLSHAADLLARRIAMADNMYFQLLSILVPDRTPLMEAIIGDYERVRDEDRVWLMVPNG